MHAKEWSYTVNQLNSATYLKDQGNNQGEGFSSENKPFKQLIFYKYF